MPIQSLLKSDTKDLLDKLISSELYSSNLYKHIAAHMQKMGMMGAQRIFERKGMDADRHYLLIRDYINDMGDIARMPSIEAIDDVVGGIGSALNLGYETEKTMLYQYRDAYESVEEDMEDCITAQFLLQFLELQRKSMGEFGNLISMFEKNPNGILEMDEYLDKFLHKL